MSGEAVKLTKAQLDVLTFILTEGPGTLPETARGRDRVVSAGLEQFGFLEHLNRFPGPAMWEITEAGRLALLQAQEDRDVGRAS